MISNSYQVKAFTYVKSYRHLGVYPSKVFSTGCTVSTTPCPPMAPIIAPGGRDLEDNRCSISVHEFVLQFTLDHTWVIL